MNTGWDAVAGIVCLLAYLLFNVYVIKIMFWKHPEVSSPEHTQDDDGDDVWHATYQNLPLKFFGGGARHNFDYYYTRSSNVEVSSIDDVGEWLLGCEYVTDREQFGVLDHWQHPTDFEATRKGDCEDFALWAWRKLVEMGHDAEFMVGKWLHDGRAGTHAWVFLKYEDEQYIYESTGRSPERMLKAFSAAHESYVPFAAVDSLLRKKVYRGMLHWITHNE